MTRHVIQTIGRSAILFGLVGCGGPDPGREPGPSAPAPEDSVEAFRQEANALTRTFAEALKAELSAAMAEGGPALAIPVCSEKAPEIASAAPGDGLTIRRIGTRVRNTKTNVPTDAERAILDRLTDRDPEFVGELDGSLTYMRAIHIQEAVCLNCHGAKDVLHADAPDALRELYPGDEAIGYALGDKRGAFVVTRGAPPEEGSERGG